MALLKHIWLLPLVSSFIGLGMLASLFAYWATVDSYMHYYWQDPSQTIAYVSDIGATPLKPLFATCAIITAVLFNTSIVLERRLRPRAPWKDEARPWLVLCTRALVWLEFVGAFLGMISLSFLSGFDTRQYPHVHEGFLSVFMGGYIFYQAVASIEDWILCKVFNQDRWTLAKVKSALFAVELAFGLAFLVARATERATLAAAFEWPIVLFFMFYLAAFSLDMRHTLRRLEAKGTDAHSTRVDTWSDIEAAHEKATLDDIRPPSIRIVLIGCSIGAGHNQAALELQARLRSRGIAAEFHDFLEACPRVKAWLCGEMYATIVNRLGWAFDFVLREADDSNNWWTRAWINDLNAKSGPTMLEWTKNADLVVTTHALATQCLGTLKKDGKLTVPLATYLCDAGGHGTLFHDMTDLNLAASEATMAECARYGHSAEYVGPLVGEEFTRPVSAQQCAAVDKELGLPRRGTSARVLVSGGSLGIGNVVETVKDVRIALPSATIIVLCGRNETLKKRLSGAYRVIPLGWRSDLPTLLATADVMVHNAGGMSVWEAVVTGLPIVTYQVLPGHGIGNARVMAESGISPWARTSGQLGPILRAAVAQGRERNVPAARDGAWRMDIVDKLMGLLEGEKKTEIKSEKLWSDGQSQATLVRPTSDHVPWNVWEAV